MSEQTVQQRQPSPEAKLQALAAQLSGAMNAVIDGEAQRLDMQAQMNQMGAALNQISVENLILRRRLKISESEEIVPTDAEKKYLTNRQAKEQQRLADQQAKLAEQQAALHPVPDLPSED